MLPDEPMSRASVTSITDVGEKRQKEDELDPELIGLPDPPKQKRTLVVGLLLLTALASLAMTLVLRKDAAYAFAAATPRDLGDLAAVPTSAFVENELVEGHVMLGAATAIRYERPLVPGSFRLMPVAGRDNVWAEVRLMPREESSRWVPPSRISGRLVRFETAGPRHRGLASAVQDAAGQTIGKDAWLIVDGATPADARWAVLLIGLFTGFAAWNAFAITKLLRKVKS